mgnify:CR=1 FL=1
MDEEKKEQKTNDSTVIDETLDGEQYEEVYDQEDEDIIREDDEDVIDSSLEIGGQIHQQSNIVKKFVQLPKDVKYSKFGVVDLANFTLKSKTYQLWNYLKKVQKISNDELNKIKEDKKEIYDIETLEDLKQHFEDTKKSHIWYNLIQNLTTSELEKEFNALKLQLHTARDEGVLEYIYSDKEHFYDSYNNYLDNNTSSEEVDDFGLMASMMTITEIKKAHQGWGTKMMNTTINVTKDEDIDEDTEEEPEKKEGFMGKLKR